MGVETPGTERGWKRRGPDSWVWGSRDGVGASKLRGADAVSRVSDATGGARGAAPGVCPGRGYGVGGDKEGKTGRRPTPGGFGD